MIVDEHTRECLAIDIARRLNSEHVLKQFPWLFVCTRLSGYRHGNSDNSYLSGGSSPQNSLVGERFSWGDLTP